LGDLSSTFRRVVQQFDVVTWQASVRQGHQVLLSETTIGVRYDWKKNKKTSFAAFFLVETDARSGGVERALLCEVAEMFLLIGIAVSSVPDVGEVRLTKNHSIDTD
jgi:hypothetical protein